MNDNYLMHHGIKGQRWGVIRTPEELGYYKKRETNKKKSNLRRQVSAEKKYAKTMDKYYKKEAKQDSKYRRTLSDEALNSSIRRMESEKRLKRATKENLNPKRTAVEDFLSSNGKKVLGTVAVGLSLYAAKKLVSKYISKEAANLISSGGSKKDKK